MSHRPCFWVTWGERPSLEPPWPRGRSGDWERTNRWLSHLNTHPGCPGGPVKTDRGVRAQQSIPGSSAQGWGPECAWLTSCRVRPWLLAWGPHLGSQWAGGTQILGCRDVERFHAAPACSTPAIRWAPGSFWRGWQAQSSQFKRDAAEKMMENFGIDISMRTRRAGLGGGQGGRSLWPPSGFSLPLLDCLL